MGFEPILEEVVGGCRSALGAVLLGKDGIPIAQVAGPASGRDPLAADSGAFGAEFSRVLDEIRRAAEASGAGEVAEAWFRLEGFSLGLWSVDADLVLALALEPDGNLGQARYLIRRNLAAIRSEI